MFCVFAKYFIFISLLSDGTLGSNEKQYRFDYVYNPKFNAFYKFHIELKDYSRASTICNVEGGNLIKSPGEFEIIMIHGKFKQYPDIPDTVWIENPDYNPYPAFSRSVFAGHLFGNYQSCNTITRAGEKSTTSCLSVLPFICKVEAQEAYYDPLCKVFGKGYYYYKNVGSCYRVPPIAYSWNQAYDECYNEGAHLVILNSEAEHNVVYNITNNSPVDKRAMNTWFFYAGIRASLSTDGSSIEFKTVLNQTLEEAGYSNWSYEEPNKYGGVEYCGSIFKRDGNYNDDKCSHHFPFLCEIEVKK